MAFYAGQIIKHPAMENPTLVVLTDRNDLDDQLFSTFSMCKDLLRQTPQQAEDRDHLRPSAGSPGRRSDLHHLAEILARRRHDRLSGADRPPQRGRHRRRGAPQPVWLPSKSRDRRRARFPTALPNICEMACRTPRSSASPARRLKRADVNTPAVFGDYIDIYDISRAVEDGATVPIYYESRLARIELDEDEKPKIDAEIAELTEDEAEARTGTAETQMGQRRGAGRITEAPRPCRRRPRAAFRGSHRRPRWQGHDRLHEPPHLRRAI